MRKKLMILLVVTLFITMMFSTGCKKKFDIQGTWNLSFIWSNGTHGILALTFTGGKESGSFSHKNITLGTYTVNDKSVTWKYSLVNTVYTGASTGDNNMSGTMVSFNGGTGTWTAVRK